MSESRGGARIAAMVEELAQAAERVGLQVRRERLMREVGYRARGGACRLREKDLLIIDSAQPPAEQLEVRWYYSNVRHHAATVEALADAFARSVRALGSELEAARR